MLRISWGEYAIFAVFQFSPKIYFKSLFLKPKDRLLDDNNTSRNSTWCSFLKSGAAIFTPLVLLFCRERLNISVNLSGNPIVWCFERTLSKYAFANLDDLKTRFVDISVWYVNQLVHWSKIRLQKGCMMISLNNKAQVSHHQCKCSID